MRHGFLFIDKPAGPTSHDCVARVRSILRERKIGHLGTLDPAASGLLVLAVGAKALKVVELFNALSKEYDAEVTFGSVSSTYDREGVLEAVVLKPGQSVPTRVDVQNAIEDRFLGIIDQVPPGYSAVNVGGTRAYRKMRQGRAVDLPPRAVEITACDIESFAYPLLALHIACGSGTYIRSLAHDLGQLLRCGGYLSRLRRTQVGDWRVDAAVKLDAVKWSDVLPLKEVLADRPKAELDDRQRDDVTHGRDLDLEVQPDTIAWCGDLPVAVLVPAKDGTRRAHARKVL